MIEETLMKQNYPKKEEFYSNFKVVEITDGDYMHGRRVCKDFEFYKDL